MKKRYYMAYGSNLNVGQMKQRCPGAKIVGRSEILGYQLIYKGSKTGAYLTIEQAKGKRVPVAIWSVTEQDERNLDWYEGYPKFYYKELMPIPCYTSPGRGFWCEAFVYIMHEDRLPGIPSDLYVETCREGYRYFGFEEKYLDQALRLSEEDMKWLARKQSR